MHQLDCTLKAIIHEAATGTLQVYGDRELSLLRVGEKLFLE